MREPLQHWQKILANGFSSAQELLNHIELPSTLGSELAEKIFKTKIPRRFADKIIKGDRHDPLLLQVLASTEELTTHPEYVPDPLQEIHANPIPGLIHKYAGRVLLTVTGACAINCRFCFRRHFPYADNNPGTIGWQAAFHYIAADPSITEVILSGGDPLLASDATLSRLMQQLSLIPHLQTIRIHTRIPIVLPERITPELLSIMNVERFHIVLVLHCNHPQELDADIGHACSRMKQSGWTLLNQSVLLAGVNDNPDILATLSHRLFTIGVLPYYLHLLDKVDGASHFDLPLTRSLAIFAALQHQLPGYLVPRLARETPNAASKTLISNGYDG